MNTHLSQSLLQRWKGFRMGVLEGWPGHLLGQTGGHERKQDTAFDRPLGVDLILIETQFLLGGSHIGFESPTELVIADEGFHRQVRSVV